MFKVFLVEDEIVVREGIRNYINWGQYGYLYTGDASDGEIALPLIRQIKPDLLITDIKMPFMNGLALIELIRHELPKTKIVIISGYDDFSYAQQAINMGVEQYLLKPIVKEKMVETLVTLKKKMDEERQQQEYLARFQLEAQEYETYSRRRFFEKIVTGGLSVLEITETAKTMGIAINAPLYNIVLFSLSSAGYDGSTPESYLDSLAAVIDKVMLYIVRRPELILFRWNVTTYAVLIKGEKNNIGEITSECVENIKKRCVKAGQDVDWHIASSTPVPRLSAIPACFAEASRVLSYRYLCPEENILSEKSIRRFRKDDFTRIDTYDKEICRERIRNFVSGGSKEETDRFIEQLFQNAGKEVVSQPLFCRYLTMSVYLAVTEYLETISSNKDSLLLLELRPRDSVSGTTETRQYVRQVIWRAIELRDLESKKQRRDLISQAIRFIDEHYPDETISLNKVARKINISPNYFSAMFSQEIGDTFVGYLTNKRIGEAKRMLRRTCKRSSEIAFAVGYKDPHYFSFVFRKVAGCTPSEYRKENKK